MIPYSDRIRHPFQSERGASFVREDGSYWAHTRGVQKSANAPSGAFGPQPSRAGKKAKVLFITSNGIGLGHLTRMMAIARRLPSDKQAIFLTLSQGLPLIMQEGFFGEYFPAKQYLLWCKSMFQMKRRIRKEELKAWNEQLRGRLHELIAEHDPEAVVFDGVNVYGGLQEVMARDFDRPFIWSRRAMWKPGRGEEVAGISSIFDAIMEPGELAESMDVGWTVAERQTVTRIPPVIFLDESDLLDQNEARCVVGLDAGKMAVLIQLGSGNLSLDDIQTPINLYVRLLRRIPELQIVVAESPISGSTLHVPEGVRKASLYPLSKYYRAFDFVISASGYNSYHELIAFAVPTIFVPNLKMFSDDQAGRARYAEQAGVGLCIENVTTENVQRCLNIMLDEERRKDMVARCRELARENGAEVAVKLIEDITQRWTDLRKTKCRKTSLPQMAPRVIHGLSLRISRAWKDPAKAWAAFFHRLFGSLPFVKTKEKALPRNLLLTLGLPAANLERFLTEVHRAQTTERGFAPIFVTDSDAFHLFRQYGFLFEYIPSEREWKRSGLEGTWSEFSARRIQNAIQVHRPRQVIAVHGAYDQDAIGSSIRHISLPD